MIKKHHLFSTVYTEDSTPVTKGAPEHRGSIRESSLDAGTPQALSEKQRSAYRRALKATGATSSPETHMVLVAHLRLKLENEKPKTLEKLQALLRNYAEEHDMTFGPDICDGHEDSPVFNLNIAESGIQNPYIVRQIRVETEDGPTSVLITAHPPFHTEDDIMHVRGTINLYTVLDDSNLSEAKLRFIGGEKLPE